MNGATPEAVANTITHANINSATTSGINHQRLRDHRNCTTSPATPALLDISFKNLLTALLLLKDCGEFYPAGDEPSNTIPTINSTDQCRRASSSPISVLLRWTPDRNGGSR